MTPADRNDLDRSVLDLIYAGGNEHEQRTNLRPSDAESFGIGWEALCGCLDRLKASYRISPVASRGQDTRGEYFGPCRLIEKTKKEITDDPDGFI